MSIIIFYVTFPFKEIVSKELVIKIIGKQQNILSIIIPKKILVMLILL